MLYFAQLKTGFYVGVIQRQGIKDSIVAYFGVALGAINSLFIYPLLPNNVLGLFQFLISTGLLIGTLLQLGMPNVSLRFFNTFRTDDNRHNGFLFLLLSPSFIGFIIFTLAAILLAPIVRAKMIAGNLDPLLPQYLFFLIPLSVFVAFNAILAYYIKNFLRIVIPTLLESVWVKIATGVLSFLLAFSFISLTTYVTGIVAAYGVVTVGLFLYARWLGQLHLRPNFTFLHHNKPLLRQIGIFALYGILGSVGGNLMTQIDRMMIPLLMGKMGADANGIFSIVAYIGTTIDIPRKSLERIASPTVAHAIAQDDWQQVEDLYKRSSINLFIIGSFLFLGIWLNLDSVFAIMSNGEKYIPYKSIVFILGIASLIDMATSINTHIISYSRHFRVAFYIIIVLAGLNIGCNYLFIKTFRLGIEGAALATLTSIVIYNITKFLFIYRTFKMQPLSMNTFWIILISIMIYFVVSLLPSTGIAIIDILYKSSIISILYIFPILYFKLSPDLNLLFLRSWESIRKRLNF